ncbi:hypothetical protein HDU76_006856 [Blyttiomyces sp. JEL0837]|nr:hypothetical protein HDU76_006856 [Blyttiomyces sp. JEL0837]
MTNQILGDVEAFAKALKLVSLIDFDMDVNVSVFETNIRVVGGLLSAHSIATMDPDLAPIYDWSLLDMAEDVANRLLPAFDTPTGLPYGTVNLKYGVSEDESKDVCTACASTFSLEFTWLSLYTGNPIYERVARRAVRALWSRRSSLDLVGNHINVITGDWTYKECSVGSFVDSFYEYLLKASIAFSDEEEYREMFIMAYSAAEMHMKKGNWHMDVMMDSGTVTKPYFYSLAAFWPGLKVLAGDVSEAVKEVDAIASLLRMLRFLPEALNWSQSLLVDNQFGYPLRPEFIESLWISYQATKNPTILFIAFELLDRLNVITRTRHGFANVADIVTLKLDDKMESFFLAETLKYFYLLFDPDNEFNGAGYVFNTEAHPLPVWPTHYTWQHSDHDIRSDREIARRLKKKSDKVIKSEVKTGKKRGWDSNICPAQDLKLARSIPLTFFW